MGSEEVSLGPGTNTPNDLHVKVSPQQIGRLFLSATSVNKLHCPLSIWDQEVTWQELLSSMRALRPYFDLTMAMSSSTDSLHSTTRKRAVPSALNSLNAVEAAIANEAQRINKLVFISQTVGGLLISVEQLTAFYSAFSCAL